MYVRTYVRIYVYVCVCMYAGYMYTVIILPYPVNYKIYWYITYLNLKSILLKAGKLLLTHLTSLT
jgi:hypothetical protein